MYIELNTYKNSPFDFLKYTYYEFYNPKEQSYF